MKRTASRSVRPSESEILSTPDSFANSGGKREVEALGRDTAVSADGLSLRNLLGSTDGPTTGEEEVGSNFEARRRLVPLPTGHHLSHSPRHPSPPIGGPTTSHYLHTSL